MQAKISAGNDCLRFLRVTGGNLPAPAGKLGEAFYCSGQVGFFQRERGKARFLLSSSKHFEQSNHFLLLKSMVNPSNLILFRKSWSVPCCLFKPLYKKNSLLKKSSLPSKWSGTGYCHFFGFFTHTEWRRDNQQK